MEKKQKLHSKIHDKDRKKTIPILFFTIYRRNKCVTTLRKLCNSSRERCRCGTTLRNNSHQTKSKLCAERTMKVFTVYFFFSLLFISHFSAILLLHVCLSYTHIIAISFVACIASYLCVCTIVATDSPICSFLFLSLASYECRSAVASPYAFFNFVSRSVINTLSMCK